MSELAKILERALSLEAQDRAALAEKLLASLDNLSESEAEAAWVREAERRLEGARTGAHRMIPSADVHEKANQLFG